MLNWDAQYSVGVKEIDEQHKRMIDYINELESALNASDVREHIVRVLNGLVAYTRDHFATEEAYFRKFDYENTEAHISEHMNLISDVEIFVYRLETGAELSPASILHFLRDWLLEHIMGADKEYMNCFHKNGLC